MTAPLALFLTRFSMPPPLVALEIEPPAANPTVTLTQLELDASLEAAARSARSDADHRHAAEIAAIATANEIALAERLAAARDEWTKAEGARLAELFESRFSDLRAMMTDCVAAVLRPLLADAARASTAQALTDALDRLLADPKKPLVRICGPEDLLAVLRQTRPAAGIEWIVAETADITVTADATHMQTRLSAALTDIAATEI